MRIKQKIPLSSFSIFMSAHSVFCYTTVFYKRTALVGQTRKNIFLISTEKLIGKFVVIQQFL